MVDENGTGIEADDLTEIMPDPIETPDTDTDDDGGLRALLAKADAGEGDEADEDEDATGEADPEAEATATAAAAKAAEAQPDQADDKRFSQRDVERFIGERLARDRGVKAVRELEAVTGLPLDKLVQNARQNRILNLQEQHGMDAETATRYVAQQEENLQLKAEHEAIQAERQQLAYQREKAPHLGNPLVKQYEAEIDAFAGNGTVTGLTFADAAAYILGQKVASGELLKGVQQAAEQKTLAQVHKRGRAAPINTAQAGAQADALNATERALAKKLGVDPKDWATEKNRIQRAKR